MNIVLRRTYFNCEDMIIYEHYRGCKDVVFIRDPEPYLSASESFARENGTYKWEKPLLSWFWTSGGKGEAIEENVVVSRRIQWSFK